jgi:hypothetical protein
VRRLIIYFSSKCNPDTTVITRRSIDKKSSGFLQKNYSVHIFHTRSQFNEPLLQLQKRLFLSAQARFYKIFSFSVIQIKVAPSSRHFTIRFFLVQYTKMGKIYVPNDHNMGIPNGHKIYQMAVKCSN